MKSLLDQSFPFLSESKTEFDELCKDADKLIMKYKKDKNMEKKNTWTQFWDMHSGGGTKESPYEKIYIEAPEKEATIIFYNRFGHNPNRVSCTCCGEDYSISESDSLEQATGYHRGCKYDNKKKLYLEEASKEHSWNKFQTIEEYSKNEDVLIIYNKDIKPEERIGEVPEEGYVWR